MIQIQNLRLSPGQPEQALRSVAAKALGVPTARIQTLQILRKSLDARRREDIHWQYRVAVSLTGEPGLEDRLLRTRRNTAPYKPVSYLIPRAESPCRPVVVGFGPAGMFAALVLAEAGLRPVVLERGGDVDTRREKVRRFWENGTLDPECNVQFGEGGAGTFSDGKLATGTHDPRNVWVLEKFRDFGAPQQVVYDARPHVGTDILADVVKNLRMRICLLGGVVRFGCRCTGIETDGGAVAAVRYTEADGSMGTLPCRDLILAPGHSARDTFQFLARQGLPMERKSFAMGVRIEHLQRDLDLARYGMPRGDLPPTEYRLSIRLPGGGSVYSFCMCPGGYVAAAASEAGGVVTNGMSYSGRAGENANAALLTPLSPETFPGAGLLAGVDWQRQIERNCFAHGGGNYLAPAQLVGDFLKGRESAGPGKVLPTYRPGVVWCDLRTVLPPALTEPLATALPLLGKQLPGFDHPEAVLTAPETRSSCPVRILRRGDTLQSPGLLGLYPCGEGAGYAGGITSAAVDGMRCAESVLKRFVVDCPNFL